MAQPSVDKDLPGVLASLPSWYGAHVAYGLLAKIPFKLKAMTATKFVRLKDHSLLGTTGKNQLKKL